MKTSMNPDEGLSREEYDNIPLAKGFNWQNATSDEIFSEMQKMIDQLKRINPKASSIKYQKVKKGPGTHREVAVY